MNGLQSARKVINLHIDHECLKLITLLIEILFDARPASSFLRYYLPPISFHASLLISLT